MDHRAPSPVRQAPRPAPSIAAVTLPGGNPPSSTRSIPGRSRPADGRRPATWRASRRSSTTCAGWGRRGVALAVLSVAAGRLRLRRLRLLRRRPRVRRPRRLRPPARRLPRAGPAAARRLGAQPHVRPAPVVRGRPVEPRRPQRDWYIWRDGTPTRPPNNWMAAFPPSPAWTWDEATGQWYLHQFLPEQPDLNWANPEVVEAMHDVMRFWLDRGVDGFRIDVVHGIGKDPGPARRPARDGRHPAATLNDTARTHELLRGMRKLVDSLPGRPLIVGEVYLLVDRAGRHLLRRRRRAAPVVQLPAALRPLGAGRWRRQIADTHRLDRRPRRLATWVLSNHDNVRHRTRYGSEDRARAACSCCWLRGSPVPVRRRGAGPGGRRGPARPGGRPRRPRRLPGADPLDRRGRSRLGRHRRLAAVAARGRRPQRRRRRGGRPGVDPPPLPPPAGRPPGLARPAPGRLRVASTQPDVVAWRRPSGADGADAGWWRQHGCHRPGRSTLAGTVVVASDGRARGAVRRRARPPTGDAVGGSPPAGDALGARRRPLMFGSRPRLAVRPGLEHQQPRRRRPGRRWPSSRRRTARRPRRPASR